ncbi:MAG: IS630 family transposase [Clostridiales bacterium]|jgi:transposase|nr:IS630 family transposase [Clostridiales bacterium]
MEYIDLRKLDASGIKQVRSQVVRLKEMGKTGKEIEEITGVRQNRISEIWTAYKREGKAALMPKKSGRRYKSGRLLTDEQEREIRQTIIGKAPNQLKLAGFLWTLAKISQHIWQVYRKRVSVRSLSNYMKRWGLTCQRPTKRACGQDIERIERFEKEEYPAIAARAKVENADIYWGDETGVSNRENFERGFSEKGKTPVPSMETKRERVNMISAITNQGHVRFMVYQETMNQRLSLDFLRRLVAESERKAFLILDNLRVHHGKIVSAWLEKHKNEIELFFPPPYAPESNPDEYLNHALKLDVHSGDLPRDRKDITHKIHSFMRRLQHHTERVTAFFRHNAVSYV